MKITYVTNSEGTQIDYEAAVLHMDDELREELHMELDKAMDQLHKASDAEIAKYGVYDSPMDPDIVALAERIRASDIWILEDVKELCIASGMESEWESADGDTFEYVAQEAADRLGVEII